MRAVDAPRAALQRMKRKRAIDATPKVVMFDRHETAKTFPLPIVVAPLV
jgi:hypothetical protein